MESEKLYYLTINILDPKKRLYPFRQVSVQFGLISFKKLFESERGKHFDQELTDAFLDNFQEFLDVRDTYRDEFPDTWRLIASAQQAFEPSLQRDGYWYRF